MNKYEAMIILSEAVKDAAMEDAIGHIRAEIKKHGGEVESTTRLGKRAFARPLNKKDSGNYVLIVFSMEGTELKPLQARLKLSEEVFRTQIVRARPRPAAPAKVTEDVANDDA